MPNSGRVGKAQEQAIVRHAKANGFPGADRIIRTGAGKGYAVRADEGDIWLCPGVVVQSKRLEGKKQPCCAARSTADMELKVPEWLAETNAQRIASKADFGVLIVYRRGFTDISKWWAFWTFWDLLRLQVGSYAVFDGVHTQVPVRLTVADAYTLLRAAGYGTPVEEDA